MEILRERLRNQGLLAPTAVTPAEVVQRLGAVQAQDYAGARWAVAQRASRLTAAAVDAALADGSILRTHVLRPTWHLVTPADIRWMLALSAPRVKALAAYGNRESGLDGATIAKSNGVLARTLRGGHMLTRAELGDALRRAGIVPRDLIGLGRLMLAAELDAVICSGGLRGKQHTYALFDERVPPSDAWDRGAALAALADRYFTSHGPATVKDFVWWSGLSATDAGAGVTAAHAGLAESRLDEHVYWAAPRPQPAPASNSPVAHLLPNFDEYTVGYTDRSMLIDADDLRHLNGRFDLILSNVVIVDGRVRGTWKRTPQGRGSSVAVSLFAPATPAVEVAIATATHRYAGFMDDPTTAS